MSGSSDITKVALVTPVFNRRETTLQCLRSLDRIDTSGIELKIYVVDDRSTDGTANAVRENFPDVVLIEGTGKLHYAAGTNRGMSAAMEWGAEFVVTINDDAVFHCNFLQRLLETARTRKRSIVGSLLLVWDEPHRVFQIGLWWNTIKGGWVIPNDLTISSMGVEPVEVEVIVGNCVLFPCQAIEECGLMDERRFPNGWGDAQYTVGMKKQGWNLVVDPRSLVWCEPNTIPPGLHTKSFSEQLEVLFKDRRHPANLHRQFVARWYSAPSRKKAAASFLVYCGTMLGKAISYYKGAG